MPEKNSEEPTCDLCGRALPDDKTVVQVVEDRHPTYDSEIVLSTFHPDCWHGKESATHRCTHCGCRFHLQLLATGEDYQNLSKKLFCPFCGTLFNSQMGFEEVSPLQNSGKSMHEHSSSVHACASCGQTYPPEQPLQPIEHFWQRVEAGDVVPSGQCPDCGGLCYLKPGHTA